MSILKMRRFVKQAIFICQVTDDSIKVVKCLLGRNNLREIVAVENVGMPSEGGSKDAPAILTKLFHKLGYVSSNPIILSFPRLQATCRYIKVPSSSPEEIEKIVRLQASAYLPYPAEDLTVGYKIVSVDKDGYAQISLVIAHKDSIERVLKGFDGLRNAKISIILSSYGMLNFFKFNMPGELGQVMLIDIDALQVDMAIVNLQELIFSRSFKINRSDLGWRNSVIDEINKTKDAFSKESFDPNISKIFVLGARSGTQDILKMLGDDLSLPVEAITYDNFKISPDLCNTVKEANISFVSLFGLGADDPLPALNLLPQNLKDRNNDIYRRKGILKAALFTFGIILAVSLAVAKNFNTKNSYLARLELELSKISQEAKPLEEIEKKMQLVKNKNTQGGSCLDMVFELHQIIPDSVSLVSFSYEDKSGVILRGQAPELNLVFSLVLALEKSEVFKKFNTKVRYASQRKLEGAEFVDFEVLCLPR